MVAEGIETQSQLEYIQEKHCNEAQGYYFSKPISYDQLIEFLKNKNLG
ncbi:EAL domain-containing protein [Sphaerochaeta sp. S2]